MQRAVEIALGMRDVVVEFAVDRLPQVMHDAQRGVAVLDLVDDDAQRAHVVDLLEVDVLAAHLVPDAVDVFRPTIHLGLDARRRQFLSEAAHGGFDEVLALRALFVEHARDALVGLGFEVAEGQVFELPFHLPDAEAVGQRRVDQLAFARHLVAQRPRPVAQKAQGLHPAGQAQHDHADVIHHGEQHLAQDLGLRLHVRHALAAARAGCRARQRTQPAQAPEAFDQPGHRVAKADFQSFGGVLKMVAGGKQQGGTAHFGIEVQRGGDQRHADGVLPRRLAAAQQGFTIGRACQLVGGRDACRLVRRKPRLQPGQCVSRIATRRKGMNHGDHARIIPWRAIPPETPKNCDES
jgi:hypothetical protein